MYQHLTKLLLAGVVAAFGFTGSANAVVTENDTCELGGGNEAGDIDTLSASYDAANDLIIVEILLCGTKDNKIKYRVHFDHTDPFFDDPPGVCATTSDDTMKRFKGNKDTGPGAIVMATTNVANDTLIYTVAVDDLDPALMLGDTVFIWADTQHKGIIDRAPDTDGTDSCSKPEVESEVVALTLEEQQPLRVFVSAARLDGEEVGNGGNGALGGDMHCQAFADAVPLGGTWMAWLSDTNTSPDARFTKSTGPYELVDGTLIADDYADLIDCTEGGGSDCLAAFINLDELGVARGGFVWTGTNSDGTAFNPGFNISHCSGWTVGTGGAGKSGFPGFVDSRWTNFGFSSCSAENRLYCFEQ